MTEADIRDVLIFCLMGNIAELQVQIHAAKRAYHHERVAMLAAKLAAERARLAAVEAA